MFYTIQHHNRSQITSVGHAHSAPTEMPVGVPQGSKSGPVLFLIYAADLADCLLASDLAKAGLSIKASKGAV